MWRGYYNRPQPRQQRGGATCGGLSKLGRAGPVLSAIRPEGGCHAGGYCAYESDRATPGEFRLYLRGACINGAGLSALSASAI